MLGDLTLRRLNNSICTPSSLFTLFSKFSTYTPGSPLIERLPNANRAHRATEQESRPASLVRECRETINCNLYVAGTTLSCATFFRKVSSRGADLAEYLRRIHKSSDHLTEKLDCHIHLAKHFLQTLQSKVRLLILESLN